MGNHYVCFCLQNHYAMKNVRTLFAIFFSLMLLAMSSCASASKQFSRRLRGTWNIVNYDVQRPDVRAAAMPNYGTITFNKNGTGILNATNMFLDIARRGNHNFEWNNTENTVVIKSNNSEFSKSWIVMTNKKGQQIWKSTDGANAVQTLELRR